jgi:hypothetical protein
LLLRLCVAALGPGKGKGMPLLVGTMKLDDQFTAPLQMILKSIKPAFVQNRADVERSLCGASANPLPSW